MLRLNRVWFGWMLLLIFSLWSVVAHAEQQSHDQQYEQQFQYRYVSLRQFVPPGYRSFHPSAINNDGKVYGTISDRSSNSYVAVYSKGVITILQPGYAYAVNKMGTVGGFVIDPTTSQSQAALFHGKRLELVPPQPGETSSEVFAINDRGTALVSSYDDSGFSSFFLYRKGQSVPLYFDSYSTPEYINNQGIIAGTINGLYPGLRGFRFNPKTDETTLLNPLPSDSHAWSQGLNNRGDTLGYSFISSGKESIGVWNRNGTFKTYFVQGIPEFPTISNGLRFNDNNLIVITSISTPTEEKNTSYLVPKPGVRLNLAELVVNLPSEQHPNWIIDINKKGSMIGYSMQSFNIQDIFLLERIDNKKH